MQLDFHWDRNIICLCTLSSVPKTYFNCFSKCRASAVGPQVKCVQYWSKSFLHSTGDSVYSYQIDTSRTRSSAGEAGVALPKTRELGSKRQGFAWSLEHHLKIAGRIHIFPSPTSYSQPWLRRHTTWFCLLLPLPTKSSVKRNCVPDYHFPPQVVDGYGSNLHTTRYFSLLNFAAPQLTSAF